MFCKLTITRDYQLTDLFIFTLTPSLSISASCSEHLNSNNVSPPNIAPINGPSFFRQLWIWEIDWEQIHNENSQINMLSLEASTNHSQADNPSLIPSSLWKDWLMIMLPTFTTVTLPGVTFYRKWDSLSSHY